MNFDARLALFVSLSFFVPAISSAAEKSVLMKVGPDAQNRVVKVVMDVEGTVRVNPDGKKLREFPMALTGTLQYDERILGTDAPVAAIRKYEEAWADMKLNGQDERRTLPASKTLVAAELAGGRQNLFLPEGHFNRSEVDLINVQCSSLLADYFLPAKEVKVGEEWTFENDRLAELFLLDAVSQNDLKAKLVEITDQQAKMEVTGSVAGAIGGVATDLNVKAKVNFNLEHKLIEWVAVAINEDRAIAHNAPGFKVKAVIRMLAQPLEAPITALTDAKLAEVDLTPNAGKSLLEYEAPEAGFRLLLERDWTMMSESGKQSVFRLVKQGDLIAQCNVTRISELKEGEQMTLEAFQQEVQKSLGKNFGQFADASQNVTSNGLRQLRVTAQGVAEGMPIEWIYYLLSDDSGRRYSIVFTLETSLTDKFAEGDRNFAAGFEMLALPEPKATAGSQSGDAPAIRAAKSPETSVLKK
ncbi:hypothetical protein [Blastopirellula marina]|uniref:SLA1 homology domain-containing protein n=1 Tax=Blastopirellula marina TaxID=124 RepID=A0A2S8GUE0_9BACT|nr:hypothetical protein [Blastopirellula marina]PQO35513.1 hypothetical protein C5Y98_12740 [Blastopirellula marina]PQO48022.1 hypothetical protein C5Y93_01140 [Blastopirellula marina]PTL44152.1 hypothetical protein C5Y97_12750 [Blastopirellula marina]